MCVLVSPVKPPSDRGRDGALEVSQIVTFSDGSKEKLTIVTGLNE